MNYVNKFSNVFKKENSYGDKIEEKEKIKYLNKLRNFSVSKHPKKKLKMWEKFYRGTYFSRNEDSDILSPRNKNFMNIIKPIIDTKLTAILDAKIQMEVSPKNMSFSDMKQIDAIESIADVLQNCVENVRYVNKSDELISLIVKDFLSYSIGIMKVAWDQSKDDFLGDVTNIRISPFNFFPDPNSNKIDESNYIFIRRKESFFSLKKKYQDNTEMLKKIDSMRKEPLSPTYISPTITGDQAIGIKNLQNDSNTVQSFVVPNESSTQSGDIKMTEDLEIWECYLKDDSIWIENESDDDEEKRTKKKEKNIYPNGRVIVYANNIILEDKAIDYPFGFPFVCLKDEESSSFFGLSEIDPLMLIQSKINQAYYKLSVLMSKYVSKIFIDTGLTNIKRSDFSKTDILEVRGGVGDVHSGISSFNNKNLEQISYILSVIEVLKKDAKEVARVNDTMISGERSPGTTSGKMVRELQESPMSSIREIQRSLKLFLMDITQKNVTLIQLYYNQSRIIRYSSGNQFALITMGNKYEEESDSQIEIVENKFSEEQKKDHLNVVKTIKGDLSLGKYEIRIIAGSEITYSKERLAQQTIRLAQEDFFGSLKDPNNLEVRELILDNLDFPNRRAIMNRMKAYKEENEKLSNQPPSFMGLLQNDVISLKEVSSIIEDLPNKEMKMDIYRIIGEKIGLIPNIQESIEEDQYF